jgi:hypothetical protein
VVSADCSEDTEFVSVAKARALRSAQAHTSIKFRRDLLFILIASNVYRRCADVKHVAGRVIPNPGPNLRLDRNPDPDRQAKSGLGWE